MSRESGDAEYVEPGLWAGWVQQAFNGKRGQAALRALEAALVALPEHRLCEENLATASGEVCALGALGLARGQSIDDINEWESGEGEDYGGGLPGSAEFGRSKLGLTWTLAWEVAAANDSAEGGHSEPDDSDWRGKRWVLETPEARYERMLAWVRERIKPATPVSP